MIPPVPFVATGRVLEQRQRCLTDDVSDPRMHLYRMPDQVPRIIVLDPSRAGPNERLSSDETASPPATAAPGLRIFARHARAAQLLSAT